ncbi:MAG: serine hydrolase domain-containing protein [Cyclonatronaceae bacterium]
MSLLLLLFWLIPACSSEPSPPEPSSSELSHSVPELPEVSEAELSEAISGLTRLSSFILYQSGEVLQEQYNAGMSQTRTINIKSASKSVLSALTGIALEQGFISSVDDSIAQYLPQYFEGISDVEKRGITIRHLLTMSSGLESTSFRNYGRWVATRDWTAAALNGELQHPPGSRMRYSTGDSHILSAVLTEASGMSTRALAERYLFGPLSVSIGGWDRAPEGYFFGGNNMALSPQGLLRFGQLYLNAGRYEGRQILPENWVHASLSPTFRSISFNSRGHDYGYLWWSNRFGHHQAYFAWGYGGQFVFVMPELDAVAVFTANPDARQRGFNDRVYDMMDDVVVPFLYHRQQSAKPVPAAG